MTSPSSDRQYGEQLGAVLRQRDPEALRAFLEASARAFGDDEQAGQIAARPPEEMATLMHQITLARSDLGDLHPDSQAWLAIHHSEALRRRLPGRGGS